MAKLFFKSAVFTAYAVSFIIVILGLSEFSRIQIYGTFASLFFVKMIIFSAYYFGVGKRQFFPVEEVAVAKRERVSFSLFLMLYDFLFLNLFIFGTNFYKRGSLELPPEYEKVLLIVYGLWFVASLITGKFNKNNLQDYNQAITSCFKAFILMAFTMSVLFFAFRLFYYSRGQIFGTFLLLFVAEAIFYYFYVSIREGGDAAKDIESVDELKTFMKQEDLSLESDSLITKSPSFSPVKEKLYDVLDFFNPWLYDFVNSSIDLLKIKRARTAILSTEDIVDVEKIDNNSLRLFLNLHKTNDVRWLNKYFLEIYRKLKTGGYFVGNAETIALHKKLFFSKYPKYIAEGLYVLDFIYRRFFPKIHVMNKIYFAMTKGRNRIISRAEVLGRLHFCGFKVVEEDNNDNKLYFIARHTDRSFN